MMSDSCTKRRDNESSFGIVPQPFSICRREGAPFIIGDQTEIVCADEGARPSAEYLQACIERATGMKLSRASSGQSDAIVLTSSSDEIEFSEEEAYCFESSEDTIAITGKTPRGLFYGVQTLLQLLPADVYSDSPQADLDLKVDALEIIDRPAMAKIRGLHVDISRHFRTKEELLTIIDCMAMHKLNTLHLHMTDDEGWRVEIKAYPELTAVGAIGNRSNREAPAAFLRQEDVRDIVAYAKSRYISIIPEVDMPGHMGAVIKSYPELKSPTDLRDVAKVIRIDEKGREFVKNVLREVDGLFQSDCMHIGCDEVNFFVDTPIYSEAELLEFTQEVTSFIKDDLKKVPIVWDDPFENGLFDKDAVVQWWRYGNSAWWAPEDHPIDESLNSKKQPFIMSPSYWLYFDKPNTTPEGKDVPREWILSPAEVYNWDPFEDMFGVNEDTCDLVQGTIACTWSESMRTMNRFCEQTFPRLASYCERLWCGGKSENPNILSWPDYRDRVLIPFQLKRYDAMGLHYWSKEDPESLTKLDDTRKTLRKKES